MASRRIDRSRRTPRHETANRERGARARAHLTRARERERRHLRHRERERDRARQLAGATDPRPLLRRLGLFALSLAAGLGLAAVLGEPLTRWLGTSMGAVDAIAIQGNVRLSSAAVATATGVSRGSALADVDPEAVEARLVAEPWIEDANVLRLPPSTLLVRVSEREPRALLLAHSGARARRLVDADGTAFAAADAARDLPHIVGGADLASDTPHAVLASAIALLDALDAAGGAALADDDGRLELHLPREDDAEGWVVRGAAEIVLGREASGDRFERLAELLESRALALGGPRGEEGPLRIDLRFAGQAVLSSVGPRERG